MTREGRVMARRSGASSIYIGTMRIHNGEPLRPGTPVTLPGGRRGYATPDRRLHHAWDGTYRVRVVDWLSSFDFVTIGWRRDQLTPS